MTSNTIWKATRKQLENEKNGGGSVTHPTDDEVKLCDEIYFGLPVQRQLCHNSIILVISSRQSRTITLQVKEG